MLCEVIEKWRCQTEKIIGPVILGEEKTTISRKVVFLIDDNSDALAYNRIILEDDFEIFTAQSGQEALEIISEITRPDLILLDMRMEGMSGPEFLLALEKKCPELIEKIPVVFLTAMDKVPASKAVGFIRKPYELNNFLKDVHRFIETGSGHPNKY